MEANENPNWICPACRGICNCSLCRTAKGWPPTGPLYKKVFFSPMNECLTNFCIMGFYVMLNLCLFRLQHWASDQLHIISFKPDVSSQM